MNILFISSWFPTKNNPGFGVFVKEHAKAIQTTKVELVVLSVITERSKSLFKISVRDYHDESGFRIVETLISTRFRDLVYHLIPLQNRIAYSILKKYIFPKFKPDIVHSNVVFPAGMVGDFISKKLQKPHIITEHWSKIEGILRKPFLSGLAKNTYNNADKILPVSDFLRKNMIQLMPFLDSAKFQVIPNVINSDTFIYKQKHSDSDELRFCAIATWSNKRVPDKIPELFIEALSKIQLKINKRITLSMIGNGDRVDELKEFCKKQPYKTEFLGYQTKEKIAVILQTCDFLLHASTIETFGVVLVEAMMTGTPVICSNVGALPELVNDSNGVLCENYLADWIAGIEKALNSVFDLKQISENVKDHYNYQEIGKEIASVYKEL
jgi:glycosyltransferase involved in cell wall biosynthesis